MSKVDLVQLLRRFEREPSRDQRRFECLKHMIKLPVPAYRHGCVLPRAVRIVVGDYNRDGVGLSSQHQFLREKPRPSGRGGIARRRQPSLLSLPPFRLVAILHDSMLPCEQWKSSAPTDSGSI